MQAAECRHPVVRPGSKPLGDELGTSLLGPVSPKSGSSRRCRPADAKRSWADLDLSAFFDVWLRRTVKPTEE